MNYWKFVRQSNDDENKSYSTRRKLGLLGSIDTSRSILYNIDEAGYWQAFSEYRAKRKEFLKRPSKAASLKGSSPLVIAQRYPRAFNFPYSLKEYEMEGDYMKHRMKLRDINNEEKRKREAMMEAEARLEDEQLDEIEGGANTSRSGGAKIRVMAKIGVMRRLSALTPQPKTIEEGLELTMQRKGRRDFYLDPIGCTKSSSVSTVLYQQLRFLHKPDDTNLITFIKDVYNNTRNVTTSVFVTMPEQSFIRYQGAYIKHLMGFIPDPPLKREPRFTDGLRFLVTDISELDLDAEMEIFSNAIDKALQIHMKRILADTIDDEIFNTEIDMKLGASGLTNLIRTITPIQISMYQQQQQQLDDQLDGLSDGDDTEWDGSGVDDDEAGQPSPISEDGNKGEPSDRSTSQAVPFTVKHNSEVIEDGHLGVEEDLREQLTAALEEQKRLQSLVIKLTQDLEQSRQESVVLSPTVEIVCQLSANLSSDDNVSEVNSTESWCYTSSSSSSSSSLNDDDDKQQQQLVDSNERIMARKTVDSLLSSIVLSAYKTSTKTTPAAAAAIAQEIIGDTIRKSIKLLG